MAGLQPLGVLIEYRINDMNECLVTRKEAVAASQQIALKPTLALVLAEHFHDPSIGREVIVPRKRLGDPGAIGHLEYVLPAVRVVLVGTEQPEIPLINVHL